MKGETIAAISTAVSSSGIGIVRISGDQAFEIADRVYRSPKGKKKLSEQQSHTVHYGYICDGDEVLDEVLVVLMRAPRSFTAEDTVEIDCHGGVYAIQRVLEAEAVMDVIEAKNEYALKSSVGQLRGSIGQKIKDLRAKIIYHIAYIESALDDPEHISLDGYPQELEKENEAWIEMIEKLIRSANDGRIMTEGIKTVILGKPNAGKSSLLNKLCGTEKAIVTDIAGTTRDVLEQSINLHGITLNLMDTAGIRDTEDIVEQIGVQRAKKYAKEADLILYVADSSTALDENDEEIIELFEGRKVIVLLNKSDLEPVTTEQILKEKVGEHPVICVSAKDETGFEQLEDTLKNMFLEGSLSFNDEVCITNMRHKAALMDAKESLKQVTESIAQDMPEDFFSIDLMSAYESLGTIIGEAVDDDLVNEIFSKFCMGK